MTPTPQKLTLEMIEAAAMIDVAACTSPLRDIKDCRDYFNAIPEVVVPFLAAASKHTGADDLADALVADKEAIEKRLIEILSSAAKFISDPPDSDFQEGYLSAIKVIAEESLQRLADRVSAIDATLAKHRALMGRV